MGKFSLLEAIPLQWVLFCSVLVEVGHTLAKKAGESKKQKWCVVEKDFQQLVSGYRNNDFLSSLCTCTLVYSIIRMIAATL